MNADRHARWLLQRLEGYWVPKRLILNDALNQLTWNGNSPRAGCIVDANTQVENAEYTVIVSDTGNDNALIVCDPPVRNQPS